MTSLGGTSKNSNSTSTSAPSVDGYKELTDMYKAQTELETAKNEYINSVFTAQLASTKSAYEGIQSLYTTGSSIIVDAAKAVSAAAKPLSDMLKSAIDSAPKDNSGS